MQAPTLWFGAYMCKPLSQVPTPYLLWVLGAVRLSLSLAFSLRVELIARGLDPTTLPLSPSRAPGVLDVLMRAEQEGVHVVRRGARLDVEPRGRASARLLGLVRQNRSGLLAMLRKEVR
jgi:hypothetical protein